MSQTLVISDNEILNQLYITNLEVYLGTKVILNASAKEGIEVLKQSKISLIVTMNMINNQDSASLLYQYLLMNKMSIPLVVIGNPAYELEGVIVIASSYHLQNLIRSCAQILGITAKEMALKEVPQFYPIDIKFLKRISEVPCSIYLQMKDGSYMIVAKKGDNFSDITKRFLSESLEILYVNSLDRLLIINAVSVSICEYLKIAEGLDSSTRVEALKAGFQFAQVSFTESPAVAQEILNIAKASVKVMEEIVKETPDLKRLLAVLNSDREGFVYTHSILASYVSNYIVKKISWGGESHVEKINFVLFFHDILLAPIYLKHPELAYEEDLLFNQELSEKEKEVILNHARMAAEVIVTYKRAPLGVDLLIKQHHGMTNGMGFAQDYKDDISPISKVIIIAEAFIEEYMKSSDEKLNNNLKTKNILIKLNEKFKRTTYKKIIETLEDFPL